MGAVINNNRRHLREAWKVSEEVTLKLRPEGHKEAGKVQAEGMAGVEAERAWCSHRKPV